MIRQNRDRYGNWLPDVAAARRKASRAAKRAARGARRIEYKTATAEAPRKQVKGFRYALRGERLSRRISEETDRNTDAIGGRIAPNPPHLERMQTGDLARYQNIPGGNVARRERRRFMAWYANETGKRPTFRAFKKAMREERTA